MEISSVLSFPFGYSELNIANTPQDVAVVKGEKTPCFPPTEVAPMVN
jgi:hypothetical protein